jgi:uncharacterized protein (TIRG00374 family)
MNAEPQAAAEPKRRQWRQAAVYLFALACLVWVFYDVRPERLIVYLRTANWWWLLPAVVCDVLGYVCTAGGWRLLLKDVGALSLLRASQAVYVGLFANEIAPLRLGEAVRAYLVSRWMKKPVAVIVPSIILGRLIDGAWLAASIGILMMFIPLPRGLVHAGSIFGILILALIVLVLVLILHPPKALDRWISHTGTGAGTRVKRVLAGIATGLGEIEFGRNLLAVVAWSFAMLAFAGVSFWLVMLAYHIPLGFVAGMAVFLVMRLGTTLPNAPANVGSFQFFTVLGLSLFGVDKTLAASFSVVVFLVLTLPLWVLGLWAVGASGMTLAEIRGSAAQA